MSDMTTSRSTLEATSVVGRFLILVKEVRERFTRQVDIVHLSLAGVVTIVFILIVLLGMSSFGVATTVTPWFYAIMAVAAAADVAGLCYINLGVHKNLSDQTRLTEVLVNSLGQGFLLFTQSGICGSVYSQACTELLECVPAGAHIVDVLHVPEDEKSDFKDWMDMLFIPHHALGFDDVVRFLPQFFPHSQGKRVSLVYRPIYDDEHILTQVVVIATDETEEHEAQLRARQQQSYADMICLIFKERNQFLATITHIRKFIEAATETSGRDNASSLLRLLHTLKAAVKHFHLDVLAKTVSELETSLRAEALISDDAFLKELASGKKHIETDLAAVMLQVNELIGHDYEGRGNMREISEAILYDFARDMEEKNVDPLIVRRFLTDIAAVPAYECFRLFEREVRDLAEIIGKQIKPIRYTGSNPRVLILPIQEFLFSLTHISRNIIDHGIEASVTRLARGKDPAGQISVHIETLQEESNGKEWLQIIIADDGNGIDPAKVREKLEKTDPLGSWREQDDATVIQNIFSWGFSTRDKITDLSGRGVGMEAVHREVKLLGGDIRVYSEVSKGTRFDIRIPYSFNFSTSSP